MADYTEIQNDSIEPDAPILSRIGFALRDNPIAIAEGAPGAPRIQNAAMDANSVDNDNVVNGTLGAEKLQAGAEERDWVLARCAGGSRGAVGTYALLRYRFPGSIGGGETTAGSELEYAVVSDTGPVGSSVSPPGTWRNMGQSVSNPNNTTLWLRVS